MTDNTKQKVLTKISSEDVKMHSSSYFVLLGFATALSALLLTLLTAVLSRILFDDVDLIRRQEVFGFGPEGRRLIAKGFPWGLLVITILSIWGTIKIYRRMDISYKHSRYVFYGGLATALVLIAIISGASGLKGPIERHPIIENFRTVNQKIEENVVRGTVIELNDFSVVVQTINLEKVYMDTREARIIGKPMAGIHVKAIGMWIEEDFKAEVVHYGQGKVLNIRRILK